MVNEFTAIIEQDGPWFIAYSPEIPGANGQSKSKEEALESLAEAIKLMAKQHIRTLVVTDNGNPIGILNQRAIIGDQFRVARKAGEEEVSEPQLQQL